VCVLLSFFRFPWFAWLAHPDRTT